MATPFVVVGVVVVLAIGTATQIGPASGPDRRMIDRSFAVLAGPIVAQSDASGSALRSLLADGPSLGRTAFFSELVSIATGTATASRRFAALSPPDPGGEAAERCATALAGRWGAATRIQGALEGLLGGPDGHGGGDEASAARRLESAGVLLEVADGSWAACRRELRRAPGSARLPVSAWVRNPGVWSDTALGRFVAALVSSPSLVPVHRLALVTVSTDPASVPGASGVVVVPPTTSLQVHVVVADQGNVDEMQVSLVVTAVPQGLARAPAPVGARTALGAGDSVTLSPPPLSVRPASSYLIDITATGATGASATKSLSLRVSAVTSTTTTTTTTTTAVATTTTVRAG
jgi:hypothetical protein